VVPDDPARTPADALVEYYRARAAEYEHVYEKPERQADLRRLHETVPAFLAGRRVLEVACGTGYWTRLIAPRARAVIALDLAPEVLELARARQREVAGTVDFRLGDAFALDAVDGDVDAAFAGFWWSHLRRDAVDRFLCGLHRRLPPESPVMVLDNRYVEGSNWPITRRDAAGNTYQWRRLDDGSEHEVLKNFPAPSEVEAAVRSAGGADPAVETLDHYWYATYRTGSA
jgi:demethylmenaquinone methyltransferase/2-methoxy-6-polyprenyl-1,4-benzoquinol methylase